MRAKLSIQLFQSFTIPLLMFVSLLVSVSMVPGKLRWILLYSVITIGLILSRNCKFRCKVTLHGILLLTMFLFSILLSCTRDLPDWNLLARALSYISCIWAAIIVLQLSNKRITCENLLTGFEVFGIILILLSLISFLDAQVLHGRYWLLGLNPNWAGASLGFSVLVIGLKALLGSSSKLNICRFALVILGFALIYKTGSRTPVMAGVISLFVILPILQKPIRARLVSAFFIFVVALILFSTFSGGVSSYLLKGQDISEPTTGRLASINNASWGEFYEHIWLGNGLGKEMDVIVRDVGIVTLLCRIGIVGVTLFGLLVLCSLKEWFAHIVYMNKMRCCSTSLIVLFSAYSYLLSLNITENYINGVGNWATTPLFVLCILGFVTDDAC